MSVQNLAEVIEVGAEFVAKVARIAECNDIESAAKAEGKALKGEVIEAVGGADMVALFPEGVRIAHDGVILANVKPQSRVTISQDNLTAALGAVMIAHPDAFARLAVDFPEAAEALALLPQTAAKVTTYPVVRTK